MIVYSLHRGGWKRQRVSWLIPAKNIRIEQFVFVVSNNRLLDFNPFHLLVLLVVFFFSKWKYSDSIHFGSRYIYIYQNHEWEEICGEINHFGKNLSRIWFCLSIPFEIVGSKTFQFAAWIRNWNIFKENPLSALRFKQIYL